MFKNVSIKKILLSYNLSKQKPAFQENITSRLQQSRQTKKKNSTTTCVFIQHRLLIYIL